MQTTKTANSISWVLLALLLAMFAQGALKLPYQLRFESPGLNYWIFAVAAISFPMLAFSVGASLSTKWARWLTYLCALILAIPCLTMASCAAIEAPLEGRDLSYELISEAKDGNIAYRLYRTNCGATCEFGLDLREERQVFLGLNLVSPIWSRPRGHEGQVVITESQILVSIGSDILAKLPR